MINEDTVWLNVDTRDFAVAQRNEPCAGEIPPLKRKRKLGNKFFFTTEEVLATLQRWDEESAKADPGDIDWRYFVVADDELDKVYGWGWQFKYLRFIKTKYGWIWKERYV